MSESKGRRLFPEIRHPYYIAAPGYKRTSAGIKSLHMLCDALNRCGERAYMVLVTNDNRPGDLNPDLQTPLLTQMAVDLDQRRGLTPIVVYPETISGNPLNAHMVVRYVMNFPGLLGGDTVYPPHEFLYAYSRTLADAIGQPDRVLFVPASDARIFRPDPVVPRSGACFYAGKYKYFHGAQTFAITEGMYEITRDFTISESPEQLANLLRSSELFYCYENSAMAIEAVLCGCPVVFLPNPYFDRVIGEHELGWDGYAWGAAPAEIAQARATVQLGQARYLRLFDTFWDQLDHFVAVTQAETEKRRGGGM